MTADSYRAAVRPLILTAAWFAFLACTAFAWAAIEGENTGGGGTAIVQLAR